MNETLPAAPGALTCQAETCRSGCSLEVIDSLLRASGSVRGDEVDALLDLRSLLRRRQDADAEAVLAAFCPLRRAMEARHYLAFYRLRRWLENHMEVHVHLAAEEGERVVPLRLERYCLEAVRVHSIQGELGPTARGRVEFRFRQENREAAHAPLEETACPGALA